MNKVEIYKANGRYRHAGQLQALMGHDDNYGCHYGMTSSRSLAIKEFKAGWQEVNELVKG